MTATSRPGVPRTAARFYPAPAVSDRAGNANWGNDLAEGINPRANTSGHTQHPRISEKGFTPRLSGIATSQGPAPQDANAVGFHRVVASIRASLYTSLQLRVRRVRDGYTVDVFR